VEAAIAPRPRNRIEATPVKPTLPIITEASGGVPFSYRADLTFWGVFADCEL
jgi:hypothetical protein